MRADLVLQRCAHTTLRTPTSAVLTQLKRQRWGHHTKANSSTASPCCKGRANPGGRRGGLTRCAHTALRRAPPRLPSHPKQPWPGSCCPSGSSCTRFNPFYHQCLPGTGAATAPALTTATTAAVAGRSAPAHAAAEPAVVAAPAAPQPPVAAKKQEGEML
jgi:hypothetical protein